MQAIRMHRFGGPDVLAEERVPVPVPEPGELLVEVAYCGVCRHDLLTRAGAFPGISLPLTLGHQVSGRVAQVGSAVEGFAVGDRVMTMIYTGCGRCPRCQEGNDALCVRTRPQFLGEDRDGGYAEYVAVQARVTVRLPDAVSMVEAAIATCTLGTAYHAIATRGALQAGETVVITGASGGVGVHAVRIARMLGATVVGVVSGEDRAGPIEEAGADHVIVSPSRTFAREVRSRLGRQADLVADVVGAPTLRESLHAVRPGGRVVVVGNVEGKEVSIPPAYLILKEVALLGTKSCTTGEMTALLEAVASGRLVAEVTDVVGLDRARAVHEDMEAGRGSGRSVLEVAGG
ncbi:MAG: alcohol dehydrogenase catalytic domain-containing protein [Actinomycetota bacterium]|nr:alcohol dehydrogenase catalytic domain-containing protein [Actinomycetota bacterium]